MSLRFSQIYKVMVIFGIMILMTLRYVIYFEMFHVRGLQSCALLQYLWLTSALYFCEWLCQCISLLRILLLDTIVYYVTH